MPQSKIRATQVVLFILKEKHKACIYRKPYYPVAWITLTHNLLPGPYHSKRLFWEVAFQEIHRLDFARLPVPLKTRRSTLCIEEKQLNEIIIFHFANLL